MITINFFTTPRLVTPIFYRIQTSRSMSMQAGRTSNRLQQVQHTKLNGFWFCWRLSTKHNLNKNKPEVTKYLDMSDFYKTARRLNGKSDKADWLYFTSRPARRCSGIHAPLNFVTSLLFIAPLNFACRGIPVLRSTLMHRSWLRAASSLPHRSLNPQITPLRNFVLLWTSAGLKKGRFRMAGHKRSWLLPLLEAACPSVSPDLLLAVRGRASSPDPCSLCHSFSPCRWPAASLCWWPSVSNFFHCNFSQKPCERPGSGAKKKRQGSNSASTWAACQLERTCSSYLQRVRRILVLDKRSIRVDCWIWKLLN